MDALAVRELDLGRAVSLPLALGPLSHGPSDPSMHLRRPEAWRATVTPDGPATLRVVATGVGRVAARAWGPGAAWVLAGLPALLGAEDDDGDFVPRHPVVARLHRSFPDLRLGRSRAVLEALVPTILEQKVTSVEAHRSYRDLVYALGDIAPGPAPPGLMVPPGPAALAAAPSWVYHRCGIERRRADTIRSVARSARRVEEAAALPPPEARLRLLALPGVGPWTAAKVALVAWGDPDAVSVGDYHLPHLVALALAGERRGDDRRMLELLEPYRGHRGRVVRLIAEGAIHVRRRAPRARLRSIASI